MDYDAILHIGAGKTGSSAIQTFLRNNRRSLEQYGFAVPSADFRFIPQVTGHHVFTLQKYFDAEGVGLFHRLNIMMQARDNRTVILSAENMSNGNNHQYFTRFCQEYRTKVIFYIRRQDEYLASAWQQWFSKVHTDIADWVESALKTTAHWERIIDNWRGIIGAGNLEPRVFERQYFHNADVVHDFASALGLPAEAHQTLTFTSEEINASFSNIITSLVSGRKDIFENAHDEKFYRFIIGLTGDRYLGSGNISLLSRASRERIIAHYDEENERLRAKYFPQQQGLFAPLDHAKYRYADEIDLQAEQSAFMLDVITAAFRAHQQG
jgi:hypothetical protein